MSLPPSVNKNFVVQNGLTVGEMTIFAGNSDIRTSGNITVTGTGTINVPSIGVSSIAINDSSIAINDTGPSGSTIEFTLDNAVAANISASGMNIPTGTAFRINQTDVLSYNTLKSGVINSSLTSVGTLQNLTVSGNTAINNTLYAQGLYDNSNRVLTSQSTSSILTSVGTLTALTVSGNTAINNTLYGRGVYDNSNRVVSTSSGAGNLTISGTGINLNSVGPGATTVGSSTSVPVITTDAYGRVVALTSSAISTSFTVAGTSGTATVSGGSTLTLAGTYGVTVAVGTTYANISTPQDLQTTASPTFTGLTTSANTIVNSTLYARGVYDNSVRVVSTSSGAGNLSISGTAITLPSTGPGSASVGSSTAIPVITTDAYGRVASTSTAAVVAPASTLSGDTLASGIINSSLTGVGTLTALTVSGVTKPNANATVNLGATNAYWNSLYAVASNFNQSTIGGQGLSSAGIVTITNNSDSTGSSSGALQVTGGVGIGANLYVSGVSTLRGNVTIGGNLTVSGQSVSIGTSDLAIQDPIINLHTFANLAPLTSNDGSDIGLKFHYYDNADRAAFLGRAADTGYLEWYAQGTDVGNVFSGTYYGTVKGGAIWLANTTTSTSTTTGALRVDGGAGIAGALYAGSVFDNGTRVVSTSSGAGNLSISGTAITLPSTGPGAVTTGSGTAIPVITTDAYGRISTISTAALTAITNLSSSGTGNITVSAATGSSTLSLPSTGPGATSVGSSTAIPVITTDAYGRIASTSTAAVVAPAGTLSGSTLASGVTASGLTSVGTLTGLTVSGSITPNANLTVNLGNSTSYYGTVFAGQHTGNTFTVGGGGLSSSGSITPSANVTQNLGSTTAYWGTTYTGQLTANAATFGGGGIAPAANASINSGGTSNYWNNVYAVNGNFNQINIGAQGIIPTANVVANLGSASVWFNTFYGKSTQAQYADLAENYQADAIYEPGTVLMFGGENEVTLADPDTTAVAGIVSTNPAHLMNGALQGAKVVALALQGRVPCKVIGPIAKGDILVSAGFGFAKTAPDRQLGMKFGQAIGKALENVDPGTKATIEVVVGRV